MSSAPASAVVEMEEDDESQWEYEYSTTETESHYVTMDLSLPSLLDRREDFVVHNTRGGFRSWTNPLLTQSENTRDRIMPIGDDDDDDDDPNELPEREDPELDAEDEEPGLGARRNVNVAHASRYIPSVMAEDPKDIQILDLHHQNPIISYRGMLLGGSWADNIGTELLFMKKDKEHPVPVLRNLPDNVDLLGASSARITCRPSLTEARSDVKQADLLRKAREVNGFAIAVTTDVSNERRPQAAFLEGLMAIKKQKGETDEVTVQAYETSQNAVINDRAELDYRRKKERAAQRHYARSIKARPAASVRGRRAKGMPAQSDRSYIMRRIPDDTPPFLPDSDSDSDELP